MLCRGPADDRGETSHSLRSELIARSTTRLSESGYARRRAEHRSADSGDADRGERAAKRKIDIVS